MLLGDTATMGAVEQRSPALRDRLQHIAKEGGGHCRSNRLCSRGPLNRSAMTSLQRCRIRAARTATVPGLGIWTTLARKATQDSGLNHSGPFAGERKVECRGLWPDCASWSLPGSSPGLGRVRSLRTSGPTSSKWNARGPVTIPVAGARHSSRQSMAAVSGLPISTPRTAASARSSSTSRTRRGGGSSGSLPRDPMC